MDDRAWIREDTLTMQLAIPLDVGIYNRHIYVVHQQDRLLLSQLRLTFSLQDGWSKEPKLLQAASSVRAR